jgi:putative long chain acyl-CoA synthase
VALGRLGAVAVVLPARVDGAALDAALGAAPVAWLLTDRRRAAAPLATHSPRLCLGRGDAPLGDAFDLEADLRPHEGAPPDDLDADPGRPDDLALILFTGAAQKAARVTHRRWVAAALGAAAACQLSPGDTVYVCLPLDRAAGLLVAVSGALAGGARLALAPHFDPARFWTEVRRVGATAAFLHGDMARALLAAAPLPDDDRHPLRLLATQGLDAASWDRAQRRFGPLRIIEFYGSTEGNVALVNLQGQKPGAVGRPLVGGAGIELLRYDRAAHAIARDDQGRAMLCDPHEVGLLVARVNPLHPLSAFEGYTDPALTQAQLLRDLFSPGDAWFVSNDLLYRDEDGDFWFIGSANQAAEGEAKGV